MKALNTIRFPRLLQLQRTIDERQFDESNQFRLNQNFRAITDSIVALEKAVRDMPQSILGGITVPVDYVSEVGESGIWKYRKWNGGAIEAWAESLDLQKSFSVASGSMYAVTHELALPESLFVSVACSHVSVASGDSVCFVSVNSSSASALSVNIACTESASVSLKLDAMIVGRWKE